MFNFKTRKFKSRSSADLYKGPPKKKKKVIVQFVRRELCVYHMPVFVLNLVLVISTRNAQLTILHNHA